ncbi:MAG: hypothetical protein BGO55_30880 [Sphingobacteriales bacterium 50-39]|nr:MAG: hypothetical protein BGO55_30880 [Sphingobacteriales bacterium 50-39]
MKDEAYDPGFFGDGHQQRILTPTLFFIPEWHPGADVSLLNGLGCINAAVDIVDAFQVLRIAQQELQSHHKKRIVIRTIIDRPPASADDLDTIGLLYLLSNVKGITRLPAEAGQIGNDQVVDVSIVLLDKGVQLYKIRPVEIGGAEPLVDKAVNRLNLSMLHPGAGDHILPLDAEMALLFGAEPEIFYSSLIHMDGLFSFGMGGFSADSAWVRVAVTTSSAIRLISKMVR